MYNPFARRHHFSDEPVTRASMSVSLAQTLARIAREDEEQRRLEARRRAAGRRLIHRAAARQGVR